MKRYAIYTILASTFLFTGCQKEDTIGNGYLQINVAEDTYTISKSVSVATAPYHIEIENSQGDTIERFADHTTMPSRLILPVGNYTVRAVSHAAEASTTGFDNPYYVGSEEVTVTPGVLRPVTIVCTLANVKMTVSYSQKIIDNFTSYSVTVTDEGGNSITFDENETRAAYFLPGRLSISLNLTNTNGSSYTLPAEITDAKAQEYYSLTFDVSDEGTGDDEGSSSFEITVDPSTNEHECIFKVPVYRSQPDIVWLDEGTPVSSGTELDAFETRPRALTLKALSDTSDVEESKKLTLQSLYLCLRSDYVQQTLGLSDSIDLMQADASTLQKLNEAGLDIVGLGETSREVTVDFNRFLQRSPVSTHRINVYALNSKNLESLSALTLKVRSNSELVTGSANPWAKFAYVSGTYNTDTKPAGLRFEYKEKTASGWIQVSESAMTFNGNSFEAKLTGLTPEVTYVYRVNTDDPSIEPAPEVEFTTESAPEIPNLNFESWSQSGKTWFPNSDGANSYWATGNPGVTMSPLNKESNTQPVEGEGNAISGKAAHLISYSVPFVKYAAGNLFIGTFGKEDGSIDIMNPVGNVKFGRPYTGRPTRLTGYYKYRTKAIDTNGSKVPEGTANDVCHIYIRLWDAEGNELAYGEMTDNRTMDNFEPFTIELKYRDLTTPAATVTIVATTSKWGDVFAGGVGSELWVDEFQLDFE